MSTTKVLIEPRFLTYQQAEQFTGYSRWTIHRGTKDGSLRVCGSGRSTRFDREELARWMHAGPGTPNV